MSLDSFYTPLDLAQELVALLPAFTKGFVVDPAMGEGALLTAAQARFGQAITAAGLDIEQSAINAARRSGIQASRANFLSGRARARTTVWRGAREELGAIVLNPPFSTRGLAGKNVEYDGKLFNVGPSLEFLLTCLRETAPVHGVAAILPAGAVEADRYIDLWRAIRVNYSVRLRKVRGVDRFSGARVATYLAYLSTPPSNGAQIAPATSAPLPSALSPCVDAIRGRYPVHLQRLYQDQRGTRFLHSTDLNTLSDGTGAQVKLAPMHLADRGPFLALRRVGGWRNPVVVDDGDYVLSDCVIALRPHQSHQLLSLRDALERNGHVLSRAYGGTGASYVTMRRLSLALAELGWRMHSRRQRAGRGDEPCEYCGFNPA